MTPEDDPIVHKDYDDKRRAGSYEKALSEPTAFGHLLIEAARAARLEALEEAAKIADEMATTRAKWEKAKGYSAATATPVANKYWCEEIAAAIRERAKAE